MPTMFFRLAEFIKGNVRKTAQITHPSGKGYSNAVYEFAPKKVYETNDPIFAAYIRGERMGDVLEHVPSTPELKEQLESYHIPYQIKSCSTCTGAKPKIWYNPFVITDEEGNRL